MKMNDSILTNEDYKEQVESFEKLETTKKSKMAKRKNEQELTDDELSSVELEMYEDMKEESDVEEREVQSKAAEKSEKLNKRNDQIEIDKLQVGKYFTVFWEKPKTYYWGKILKVFTSDANG